MGLRDPRTALGGSSTSPLDPCNHDSLQPHRASFFPCLASFHPAAPLSALVMHLPASVAVVRRQRRGQHVERRAAGGDGGHPGGASRGPEKGRAPSWLVRRAAGILETPTQEPRARLGLRQEGILRGPGTPASAAGEGGGGEGRSLAFCVGALSFSVPTGKFPQVAHRWPVGVKQGSATEVERNVWKRKVAVARSGRFT